MIGVDDLKRLSGWNCVEMHSVLMLSELDESIQIRKQRGQMFLSREVGLKAKIQREEGVGCVGSFKCK